MNCRPSLAASVVLVSLVLGCVVPTDAGQELLVFAASSLSDAFTAIEAEFESTHPGVDVVTNFAASSALREQILNGAPAAIFASASTAIMDEVVSAHLTATAAQVFATNRLHIVVPAGNPGHVTGLEDFSKPELLVGLCAAGVPCGDLARQALAKAGVEPVVDSLEPDVRSLLTKIEAGELDVGIVYETDVRAAGDQVVGIPLPDPANAQAIYPITTLAAAPDPEAAQAFVEFVLSEKGQSTLFEYGFGPP